jgi:ketosteroid isomerase-like protein
MSQAHVELVLGLYPAPEVDYVPLYRDDSRWTGWAKDLAPFIHDDFECVNHEFGSERRYAGLDGVRAFMLGWMAPWVSYRIETEEATDLGERVLVLNNDRGRREGSTHEVRGRVAALWTIRDGTSIRLDAYPDRAEALEAVGLGG